jgi:hypothetical protein
VGGGSVLFTSSDGQTWTEQSVAVDAPSGLQAVVYSGERFFALSTHRTLLSSADGERWASIDLVGTVMPTDVTFGEDRYLLVGSGAPQLSSDGVVWRSAPMDCSLPGACIQDPSGNILQSIHYRAVFAEGRYYIDQASSDDGQTWQMLPELYPQAYVGGYLLGNRGTDPLVIWKPGATPQPLTTQRYLDAAAGGATSAERLRWNGAAAIEYVPENFPQGEGPPDTLDFPLADGASCLSNRCVSTGARLYLVP